MKVLLGVTGGIAAYKSAQLVREFVKRGDEVRVVMTQSARQFITPMTLQILSEHPVGTTLFDPTYESEIGHIELARWADVTLVAPATANTIAKLAHGFADDLLTTVLLATTSPVVVAPAMNTQMWRDVRVQRNLDILHDLPGYHVVAPDSGELACKEVGAGRLPDPPELLAAVDQAVTPQLLENKRVLITAGPTRESIDPARFISNPSSGKMGYAMARAAQRLGAQVTLIAGPNALPDPPGVMMLPVVTAAQMYDEVIRVAQSSDLIIKSAAVADWRPVNPSDKKRTKSEMGGTLELERTQDILSTLGELYGPGKVGADDAHAPILVGFAAESHDVTERGRAKLARKNAHWLIANKIGGEFSSFGADVSSAVLLSHQDVHEPVEVGPISKTELAYTLLSAIARHAF